MTLTHIGPKPYYQRGAVQLYHGDSLALVPMLSADVLITDPPYGVNLGKTKGAGGRHGLKLAGYASYEDSPENFANLVAPIVFEALTRVKRGAVFASSPGIGMLPKPSSLGGIYVPNGTGRHAWGFCVLHVIAFYGAAPGLARGAKHNVLRSTNARAEKNGHPCPKPRAWMDWLVDLASRPDEVVLDPFAGSGTTLVSAALAGRGAIGIELDESYCEIAARRLDALFDSDVELVA